MADDCSKTTSNLPSLTMEVDTAFLRSLRGVLKLVEMGTMSVAFVCFAVASRPKYIAATCMEFVITFSLLLLYTLKLNKKLTLFFWPLVVRNLLNYSTSFTDLFNSLFAAVFILILSLIAVSTYTVTGTLGGGIVGFIATGLWCVDGYVLFKRVTFNQPRTAATGTVN
ncbi:chemokine-like factor isoform X1 [Salmo trutta]|uniref:chemokine-like factor isoform X1 n=1 Tax=Salmo trutta TaxID=8032 RepID=UPI001131FFCD|nr:chemokine-like factor isoform X1 [Salmo trutta]